MERFSLNKDHVAEARYVQPSSVYLRFVDGVEGTWTFDTLELNMENMRPASIKAAPSGACVEVRSKWGDKVDLDALAFRVLIDPAYAAEIENTLNALADKI